MTYVIDGIARILYITSFFLNSHSIDGFDRLVIIIVGLNITEMD